MRAAGARNCPLPNVLRIGYTALYYVTLGQYPLENSEFSNNLEWIGSGWTQSHERTGIGKARLGPCRTEYFRAISASSQHSNYGR